MQELIQGKKLSDKDVTYLLSITPSDITKDMLEDFFAYKYTGSAKYEPRDYFVLEKGKFKNSENITTTVGRFIFNKLIFDNDTYGKHFSYINEPMTGKKISALQDKMGVLLLEDKITTNDYAEFIDKMLWLGFSTSRYLNSSMTSDLVLPLKDVEEKKAELKEKYKKDLDAGKIDVALNMENELLDMAKEELKNLPDMEIYNSGAKGSYGNNYKNSTVMRGVMKNLADPSKVKISTASLVEGIPPEELAYYADLITQGSYSRSVDTQVGGYENKKMSASFQSVVLDKKGSDCHSTKFVEIFITEENYELFKYRYFLDGNKLTLLNDDTKSKCLNKKMKFRTPLYCKGDKICNVCAGELMYMMNIQNLGLSANNVSSIIMNKAMKSFHDLTIKLKEVDPEEYISPI